MSATAMTVVVIVLFRDGVKFVRVRVDDGSCSVRVDVLVEGCEAGVSGGGVF
jgi:hypothetical protein